MPSRWSQRDLNILHELIGNVPPAAIPKKFNYSKPDVPRSRRAIQAHLRRIEVETADEYPDHVSGDAIAVGLNMSKETIRTWEKRLKLARDESIGGKKIFFPKDKLREFFVNNPRILRNHTPTGEFSVTLIGVLTGEW